MRPVHVPLSVRRKVADAIESAKPAYADQTLASAQAEAAIDALEPFLERLVTNTPEYTIAQPTDDGHRLKDDRS